MSDSLVPVAVGACLCPGTPHPDGDVVFLSSHLDYRGSVIATREMIRISQSGDANDSRRIEVEAVLLDTYIRYGLKTWNLLTEEQKPIEVTDASIREQFLNGRRKEDFERAKIIAEKADDLYTSEILDPLVARALKSSKATSTSESTSQNPPSSSSRPKRSKRSLTSTTDKEQLSA